MVVYKKLVWRGSKERKSIDLIIPKEICDELNLRDGIWVKLEVVEGKLIITKVSEE
ncbi:MAG: hypothetical protein QXW83_00540 [Nitrososphaerales archaeon]